MPQRKNNNEPPKPPEEKGGDELRARVQQADDSRLRDSIGESEELSKERTEARKRGNHAKVWVTWTRIKRWCMWSGFWAGVGLGLFVLLALLIVLFKYFGLILADDAKIAGVVEGGITFFVGVFVTIAIESVLRNGGKGGE